MSNDKTKNKIPDDIRAIAIKYVAAKFDCSTQFVRLCVNSTDYYYGNSNEIRKAFNTKVAELKQILERSI